MIRDILKGALRIINDKIGFCDLEIKEKTTDDKIELFLINTETSEILTRKEIEVHSDSYEDIKNDFNVFIVECLWFARDGELKLIENDRLNKESHYPETTFVAFECDQWCSNSSKILKGVFNSHILFHIEAIEWYGAILKEESKGQFRDFLEDYEIESNFHHIVIEELELNKIQD